MTAAADLQIAPGPRNPWLGLKFLSRFRREPLELLTELARQYPRLAYVRFGHLRSYFIHHPDLVREVLVTQGKQFQKFPPLVRLFRQVDGDSVFTTEGPRWLRKRRLVQKAFHPQRMAGYAATSAAIARRTIDRWQAGQVIEMTEAMTSLTLEIIGQTMFGIDVAAEAPRLREAVHNLSEILTREAGQPVHLPLWLPLPSVRRKRAAIAELDRLVWGFIAQRKAGQTDAGDFLSLLLSAVDDEGDGRGLSDQEVRDEAVTLFNAGNDSPAAALAWAGYLLARHPQVQQSVADEVARELDQRTPTWSDLPRLVELDRAIRETLRLYPSAWVLFARQAVADVRLGEFLIPRGSMIQISPYALHRRAQYFPDPEAFDPSRFAPERGETWPQYAYLPFGGGPHICVGNIFAAMEMTIILATILQKFRLELAPGQGVAEPEPLVAIRPRGGLRLRLLSAVHGLGSTKPADARSNST